MVDYISRATIGLRPRNGGGVALLASRVEGEALHHPGMSVRIDATGDIGLRRVCSALRGWQAYHMDTRGWSDIAYQVAVDQVGRAYTLRGLNIQSAANGDQDVNQRFGAFLLVLGPGEEPSAAMKATVKGVINDFQHLFPHASRTPVGHRDIRPGGTPENPSTECPGPEAEAAIHRGEFTPASGAQSVPDVPPGISLAACQYSARNPGQYLPNGTDDVVNVKAYLVRHNYALASDSFRTAYAKFQRHLGYNGAAADGIPGKTSLKILCDSAHWTLIP